MDGKILAQFLYQINEKETIMKIYTEREERQRKACGQLQKGIKKAKKKGKDSKKIEIQFENTRRNLRKGE